MSDQSPSSIMPGSQALVALRSVAFRLQLIGSACHLLALAASWYFGWPVTAWQVLLLAVNIGMPWALPLATTYARVHLPGWVCVMALAAGLALLARQTENPLLWFLPIGLGLTLANAPLYTHVWLYVFMNVSVWGILLAIIHPALPQSVESFFVVLTAVGSMAAGTSICVSFCQVRLDGLKLQRRLYAIANVDELTGLPNRRALLAELGRLFAKQGPAQNLYFLMLDADDFKKINDELGHDVGDEALAAIARILELQAAGLCFARLGGEEFAVAGLMPEAEAKALAARIVAAVHAREVAGRHLSLSIGVARRRPDEPARGLMRRADLALYEAKQAGKNRYMLATD